MGNDLNCLIGYTGFVGSNLSNQRPYDVFINSKNFETMSGRHLSRLVCAGVSAVKWKANRAPEIDLSNIQKLIDVLQKVTADKVVLISTIDVYPQNRGGNEDMDCHDPLHHAYGRHRLYFEDFCRSHFPNLLVVRLPGLFGNGIKKNIIYDLLNDNCLEMINPASQYQYYYLGNLSDDIDRAEKAGLSLVNFFTEPICTQEIIDRFFPKSNVGTESGPVVSYDMHTSHAFEMRGKTGPYLYTKEEVLSQLKNFIDGYNK